MIGEYILAVICVLAITVVVYKAGGKNVRIHIKPKKQTRRAREPTVADERQRAVYAKETANFLAYTGEPQPPIEPDIILGETKVLKNALPWRRR